MNLRKATLLLILGLLYTVVHKAVYVLFPSLASTPVVGSIMQVLSFGSALALALFAYQFLRELAPRDTALRYSLLLIIVFTGLVVVSNLPIWPRPGVSTGQRLLFTLSRMFNSLAVLVFLFAFARYVVRQSPLWVPLRAAIGACCLTAALGIVSAGYYVAFVVTGRESQPLAFLQPLAVLSFVLTYAAVLWLLIAFRRIGDYTGLVNATSNSICQKVGYTKVGQVVDVHFQDKASSGQS
jgi:hypothetical protein